MGKKTLEQYLDCGDDPRHDLPVVERKVTVSVAEDEPPGEGRVGPGELALDGVLGQDQHTLAAHLTSPREGLGLEDTRELDNIYIF